MAKTSKGVILSQASQIKSDYSFALIKATADNKSLVQDASSAELKVNALVEYSKDSQWDPKKLTSLGFPAGCFLIVDLRGQDIHAADLITNLALVRQYGYQAGVIDDLSTLDDIKALKANQIYLINSGKTNDDQDASLNGNEITDGSGKLAVGMSVKWQRDYTNVDVSGDHAGFVGMGQDTLLKGGNAFGYSTNGRDFNAVITPKGLIFRRPDAERMWRLLKPNEIADINSTVGDKVKKEVDSATAEIPAAVSAANSAVSAAESAIAASKVNSDAIVAQSAAVVEAKSAMDSATAEIQQLKANAASDVAQIRADVAQVQNEVDTAKAANAASVDKLKSDIGLAKKDLDNVRDSLTKAQSAINQNQKLINDNVAKITSDVSATKQDLADVHDSLTKAQAVAEQNQKAINDNVAQINADITQDRKDIADVRQGLTKAQSDITANQKAVNDNVAQINSDIEQDRKDIASAQQANADTVKQLDAYSKQAQEQGKTIKAVQDKQDGFSATLADVQGNVSQVSDKVSGLSASLKDAQDNVASVKAQADQLSATLTDHSKSIAILTASAKELSSTLEDADGRLSKVEQTAQTNSSTLSDVQGDLSQVKQNATKLVSTLKDAQGNISTLQQKADSLSTQLASAQGDIATLQTGIDGVKAILTSHDKSIHTLQADSKSLKDSMTNAQGDISTLQKSATSLDSEMKDHAGRLSKVEQNAATQATTLSDLQGNLSQVKQQADGLVTTLKDAQGDITQIQQKADGTLAQLKSAQGDIASLQTNITGIKATLVSHEGDIHTLQADSKTLKDDMTDAKGNISSLQKSSTKLDSEMSSQDGRLSKVEQTATEHTSTISDLGKKVDSNGGGVNLLTNTQLFDYNWTWDSIGHSFTNGVLTLDGNDDATSRMFQQLTDNDTTGKTFSVSFNARISADCDSTSVEVDAGPYDATKRINVTSKDFQHYKAENWQWNSSSISFSLYVNSGKIDITNLKLEYGAVATPYSPAPEDLATVTQVKQTADGIETTLKSAQGDIDQIKQTAKGTSEQLSNVQGDVTNIQKDVNGLKQTTADNAGNIHTLQSDSKSLHDSMQDAQGDISTLKKTSTDVTSELKDHAGRISKAEQTASTLVNEFADQQGHLNRVEQTANGTQQTVANQQGQINSIQTDVSGVHQTITGQGNQIANINVTLNGLNTKYEGVSGDLNKLKSQAQWVTVTSAVDLNNVKTPCHELLKGTVTNAPNETAWWYLTVESSESGRITQTVIADQSNNRYTRRWVDGWSAWVKDVTQTDVTALSNRITTNYTQITQNKQAIAIKADQSTVDNLSGEVSQNKAQLQIQAGQISSKVSSTDFKTLNDKVDGMKIGTRNLLHNTSDQYRTLTGEGWMGVHTSSDEYTSVANYHNGNLFTYAATISNTSDVPVELQVWRCDQNKNRLTNGMLGISAYIYPGQKDVRVFLTGSIDSNTWYLQSAVYSSSGQSGQHTIQVKDERLVEGNVEGTWEANPTDTIASIQKNTTAIDENSKLISLMAKQTEVDNVKNTAQQISSRLDVLAGEVKSKVDETRVNNIVDGKGYATTSTVQSLVDQKAGTINESITKLDSKIDESGGGINLQGGTADCSLPIGSNGPRITIENYDDHTKMIHAVGSKSGFYIGYDKGRFIPEVGETYTFSADIKGKGTINGNLFKYEGADRSSMGSITLNNNWQRIKTTVHVSQLSGTWIIYPNPDNGNNDFYVKNIKIERGSIATPYSQAPSDNASVSQLQSVTASIDGLQSRVTNYQNDTSSKYTQLSNLMQSKVGTADFERLKRSVDMQTLDSADINNMRTNGHYFVHNLNNSPIAGWVYVDVTGNGNDRIRQDVYQDNGIQHKYRRWVDTHWTGWEEGATYTEITQLQDAINLRVQKGELLSQINLTAGNTLIQSNKLYLDASSVVITGTAFIPSAAIASLSADKVNTGWLNTNNVNLGDGRTRIIADHDYMYIQPTGSAASNTGIRMGYSGLDFLTNVIPNGYSSSVPYYSVGYDGAANGYFKISAFDHINPGGATATQNWFTMYDAISLNNKEVNIAANNKPRIRVTDKGIEVRPTIFFNNENYSGTWAGFTRLDNSDTVEFNTGNNNGENFHVNSGARFMQYVYINGYARAQGWLTNSTLSKKTNIRKLDQQVALDKIRQDDQYLYEYKRNVAQGIYDPQASFIIDDVNDVSHYSVPREFIDQTGKYREPSVELSYLIAAFQEIDKQVQLQKEEIKELKEKLQHE